MKRVFLVLTLGTLCLFGRISLAQEKFTAEELIAAAKTFTDKVWDLGLQDKQDKKVRDEDEVFKVVESLILGQGLTEPTSEANPKPWERRRKTVMNLAMWIYEGARTSPDFTLRPTMGFRLAKAGDAPVVENSVVWIVQITTKRTQKTDILKWIFHLADAAYANPNLTGQRILLIGAVSVAKLEKIDE